MTLSRHNIEKRQLIELVRLNPILWDCRLPHYKRSDKKKALKWNELGRTFGVSGERVQRTFTSLREIFRRELNHEKMLGVRFKSKWEYYDTMTFLKEVIRERKSRERNKSSTETHTQQQSSHPPPSTHSNNNSSAIDEYQYFAPNDPNNPNNQPAPPTPMPTPTVTHANEKQQQEQLQNAQTSYHTQLQPNQQQQQSGAFPLPLPQMVQSSEQLQQQPPQTSTLNSISVQKQPFNVPPDVVLSLNANALNTLQVVSNGNALTQSGNSRPPSQTQQNLQQPKLGQAQSQYQPPAVTETHPMVRISSSRSTSSSPSIYIKEEDPDSPDTISLATITINERNSTYSPRNRGASLARGEKQKRDQSSIRSNVTKAPLNNLNNNLNNSNNNNQNGISHKTKIFNIPRTSSSLIIDEQRFPDPDIELDDLDDPDVDMLDDDDGRLSLASTYTLGMTTKVNQPTAREILYTKFGDFLAARLNTLNETVANDLMNRILLLIAEK